MLIIADINIIKRAPITEGKSDVAVSVKYKTGFVVGVVADARAIVSQSGIKEELKIQFYLTSKAGPNHH